MSFFRGLVIGLGVVAAIGAAVLKALADIDEERPEARHDSSHDEEYNNRSYGGGFHGDREENSNRSYRRDEFRNRHHGWDSEGVDKPISYSNPKNNHDHTKVKHESRQTAEREIQRMQRTGRHDSERLNAYYNDDRNGWFVGRSKW
jgi:hypothetical protein